MKKYINLDSILCFIIVLVAGISIYSLFDFGSLPLQWRIAGIAIIVILTLLCIALTLKKLPNWGIWTRRVCTLLLTIALGVSTFYISKVNTFTDNITDVQDGSTTISVVVLKDSSIETLEDLENTLIGVNNHADKTNSDYVRGKIDEKITSISYQEEDNYITLANQLLNKEIDALILSNSYINSASIEDTIPGFSAQLRIVESWDRTTSDKETLSGNTNLDLVKEPFTVLISGMDDIGTPNHDSRSDVNMLVMVNPQTRIIQMVSFPRDSYVPNPALGNGQDKLTHLGNHGIVNLVTGLENVIGFDIDFYAKVNFTSLLAIVDALGGVEVDVPYTFTEQNSKRELNTIHVEKGLQTLNGEEALAFARHRYSAGVGDVGRTKAQQTVLKAIIKKTLASPAKIPTLLDIAPKYMVTNVTSKQLEGFLSYQLNNMGSWKMLSCTLEHGFFAGLKTASMGNMALSCNVLSRYDMSVLAQKYELVYNTKPLNAFAFNLSNLNAYIPTAPLQSGYNVIFTDNDLSNYIGVPIGSEENPNVDDENTSDDENLEDIPSDGDTSTDAPEGETPPIDGGETPPIDGEQTPPVDDGETPPTNEGQTPSTDGEQAA